MTTREELRTMIRLHLGDLAETPLLTDGQINQWINDSIREYSAHFPRLAELHIACTAGARQYAVNGRADESGKTVSGTRAMLRVVYPLGKEPLQILLRRSEMDRRGFFGERVYDVHEDPSMTLVLGPLPKGTETIGLQITCDHSLLNLDTDVLSMPEHHLELIVLYTRRLVLQELATSEALDPSPTGVILSGLSAMLSQAREEYESKLAEYRIGGSPGGVIGRWEEKFLSG